MSKGKNDMAVNEEEERCDRPASHSDATVNDTDNAPMDPPSTVVKRGRGRPRKAPEDRAASYRQKTEVERRKDADRAMLRYRAKKAAEGKLQRNGQPWDLRLKSASLTPQPSSPGLPTPQTPNEDVKSGASQVPKAKKPKKSLPSPPSEDYGEEDFEKTLFAFLNTTGDHEQHKMPDFPPPPDRPEQEPDPPSPRPTMPEKLPSKTELLDHSISQVRGQAFVDSMAEKTKEKEANRRKIASDVASDENKPSSTGFLDLHQDEETNDGLDKIFKQAAKEPDVVSPKAFPKSRIASGEAWVATRARPAEDALEGWEVAVKRDEEWERKNKKKEGTE